MPDQRSPQCGPILSPVDWTNLTDGFIISEALFTRKEANRDFALTISGFLHDSGWGLLRNDERHAAFEV